MGSDQTHKKHANLSRPAYGDFGRSELAILGAPCKIIQDKASTWASALNHFDIAYVDADHKAPAEDKILFSLSYTDKISQGQLNLSQPNTFQNRALFNTAGLILINGNHFNGLKQIVIVHPDKPLDGKLDKLTDVVLILVTSGQQLPEYLVTHIHSKNIPVIALDDDNATVDFLSSFVKAQTPAITGLVLAGGESKRMQTDKGSIAYHGKSQRAYSYDLLSKFCNDVFISGKEGDGFPTIEDTFTGLGPFGGILSAMQQDPNAAWFAIACDLPYLSDATIKYLIANRNPSKVATAFRDSDGKFPEPLITIWEPRAYPVMLRFLSQGYSCPRKVLINSDIELLDAPDTAEFRNINFPHQRDEALKFFGIK